MSYKIQHIIKYITVYTSEQIEILDIQKEYYLHAGVTLSCWALDIDAHTCTET